MPLGDLSQREGMAAHGDQRRDADHFRSVADEGALEAAVVRLEGAIVEGDAVIVLAQHGGEVEQAEREIGVISSRSMGSSQTKSGFASRISTCPSVVARTHMAQDASSQLTVLLTIRP